MTGRATLPVVDLQARDVAAEIERALRFEGFMYVVGHGVEAGLLEQAYCAARQFFGQSFAEKQRLAYTDAESNFGYQGVEVESLDPATNPDLKEAFTMRDPRRWANDSQRWPSDAFRSAALGLFPAALSAAFTIFAHLARNLGVNREFFAERHTGENLTLRFLHYPANLPMSSADQLGAGAHTDYGTLTVLFQDDVGGLELLGSNGQWSSAPSLAGTAVINTGDLMERWSNGRYRSTTHRVLPVKGGRDRYSIALFVDPDAAVQIECFPSCIGHATPPRYPATTAGEHIRSKILASHRSTT